MRYRLENKARVYSDESLSALMRAVFTTHCPYRDYSGYYVNVQVRKTKVIPVARVNQRTAFDVKLYLPAPADLQMEQVVGCLRWAVMYIAGVAVDDWPSGDPLYWPVPKWFDKVRPLEPFAPPTEEELRDKELRAQLAELRKAEAELKRARTRVKRATTSVRHWEKRVKQRRSAIDRADKHFITSATPEMLNRAMFEEAERAITELETD